MRLLVTGSRDWTDRVLLADYLDRLRPEPVILGHGHCRGADLLADEWALQRGIEAIPYVANWYPQGSFDRGAGRRRNQLMLVSFRPDLVVAFKDQFDFSYCTGGTEHMVRIALAAGVPARVVNAAGDVDELYPLAQLPFR